MAKRFVEVLGHQMAYVEEGAGNPIVLLHGNPTSSYLWRSVIPHLAPLGRCIAPDLIGMGDSDKLSSTGPGAYRFVEHRRYLDAFLDALHVAGPATLVVHDWGSALGFDWAARHPDTVAAIAYMEAIVCPVTWDDWPVAAKDIFEAFRSPAGEKMILERNLFVEAVLPASIRRRLTDEEMAEYRRPFTNPGGGQETLSDLGRAVGQRHESGPGRRKGAHSVRDIGVDWQFEEPAQDVLDRGIEVGGRSGKDVTERLLGDGDKAIG